MANATQKNRVDDFYPILKAETIAALAMDMAFELRGHIIAAHHGDRNSESKVANRIGSLRRSAKHYRDLPVCLQLAVKEGVKHLRSAGREVNFDSRLNPAKWITTRSGEPRW